MCQSFTEEFIIIIIALISTEQSTVGVTFDQANYTVAEGSSLTVTGRLTGLTGELQSNFSLTLSVDHSGDALTSEPLKLNVCTMTMMVSTDASDVTFNPANLIINFVAFENLMFSLTIDANDDNDFEGFHSFVISLPTDSDYINPLVSDTASTTVTISDFDGEINLRSVSNF